VRHRLKTERVSWHPNQVRIIFRLLIFLYTGIGEMALIEKRIPGNLCNCPSEYGGKIENNFKKDIQKLMSISKKNNIIDWI
jgi:hypothetical protein